MVLAAMCSGRWPLWVVGGLTSATVLTLVLLPALYYLIEERAARRKRPEGPVAYVATEGES